ncbi:MAG: exported protein of unknown function [Candidatus Saccharibacteria bacterium]|nr:exported protein of unknown function [Candidatus Saccharibacteria bacterium]MDB5180989.1 exported protein of unknown function [Candidatus Saccharibacteria bacterium]
MTLSFPLKNKIFLLAAFVVLAVPLLVGSSAYAQANTSQNITMSPSSTLISVKAGSTIQKSFQVLNSGGDAYNLVTKASPYYVTGLEYTPLFTQLPGSTETATWIKVSNPLVTVGPQKSADINYTVTVPSGTAAGGYYAVLFAETRPDAASQSGGVQPRNRVGNILYITVEGDVKVDGNASVQPVGGFRYEGSIPLGFKVSNTGGVHFQATVKASVKNFSGKEVYNATIERYVLPQTQRQIPVDWAPTSPVGIYTISRSATVADKDQNFPDEQIIYVQPWIIVVFLALFLATVLYFKSKATGRRKRSSEQATKK